MYTYVCRVSFGPSTRLLCTFMYIMPDKLIFAVFLFFLEHDARGLSNVRERLELRLRPSMPEFSYYTIQAVLHDRLVHCL